jgi:hypothetical protein
MFHSPGVVSGFDDLAVMGEPVERSGGHLFVAEGLGPLPEGEIGGGDHRVHCGSGLEQTNGSFDDHLQQMKALSFLLTHGKNVRRLHGDILALQLMGTQSHC